MAGQAAPRLIPVAVPTTTRTTCPYCGVGCGVVANHPPGGAVTVRGDPDHPANRGRLCSKGSALGEVLARDDRLLQPQLHGRALGWDEALDTIAGRFSAIVHEHGPDAVAMYVSGQLLTEDYYVANKLMKGFIGSANIDTNSRLCMASAVAAHKRAFGADAVPACYEDLELADLLVITGSNMAWAHPVLFQRVLAAKQQRPEMRIVVIDPRRTPTGDSADLHLALKPGSDAVLFNGLLAHLQAGGLVDRDFVAAHTSGFEQALAACAGLDAEAVAAHCELPAQDVATFFRWFGATPRTVTLFSQGVNQSSSGVDKANAIINAHLASGRIGKPGAAPFSITGQPNAMGGREVGGLANQLAAHMEFELAALERVRRFWGAPALAQGPGLKAVDLFGAIGDGRIKAVWILSTNPVVSLPEADAVRAALARCEFVVVSDVVAQTDTAALAHVLLPAQPWGEKDGTVTNSERRISRQRAFLPPAGAARPDWWALCEVARRMGFGAAFPYRSAADIFREHAALSAFENGGARAFDIGALADLADAAYAGLAPVQWPVPARDQPAPARLFGSGEFFTPDRRARFVPVVPRPPANAVSGRFPLVFNTGRIRDQWHTMTVTGKASRLMGHMPEPVLDVHPVDAERYGLVDGALARVFNDHGNLVLRVRCSDAVRPGSVFAPMHWSGQFAAAARVDTLVNAVVDPISGQPESKHAPVAVAPWPVAWQGFLLIRGDLSALPDGYWARVREAACTRYILGGEAQPGDWREWLFRLTGTTGDLLELEDSAAGGYRAAVLDGDRLQAVCVVTARGALPDSAWLAGRFALDHIDDATRRSLLSCRPAQPLQDAGRLVCSCFAVGANTIAQAVRTQRLVSVEQVGAALGAGTNCGSCKPEIAAILGSCRRADCA